jgi:hypothetical protein
VVSVAALTVIGAGILTWGVVRKYSSPSTVHADVTRDVDKMYRTYVSPEHLAAFAKILGTAPDSYDVASTPVEDGVSAECIGGWGTADVTSIGPGEFRVSTACYEDARVWIGQLYSPLWRVVPITGSLDSPVLDSSSEGLIEVSLSADQHDFELVFDTGWPEQCGVIVTAASILVAVGGSAFVGLRGKMRKRPVDT